MESAGSMTIKIQDPTGQLERHASVPRGVLVGGLIEALLPQLDLPTKDMDGRDIVYHLRSESTGEQLSPTQKVGEAVAEDDTVRLMPEITPGLLLHSSRRTGD